MNIYQLEDYDVQGVDAGSKARIDVCQILHEQGIEALLHHYEKSRLKRLLESIKLTFIKKKDKRLIVQYPISRWNQKILRRSKGQGIIYLIHDLQSIRCGRLLQEDLQNFTSMDTLIVHNSVMAKLIRQTGFQGNIIELMVFDLSLIHILATLYPCIQYLSCPHQGPSAARNIGLQHAKGKLISFIDSDVYKRQIWECISFSRIGSTIIYQADQRRSAIDVNQSQYDKVFNDFRRSG